MFYEMLQVTSFAYSSNLSLQHYLSEAKDKTRQGFPFFPPAKPPLTHNAPPNQSPPEDPPPPNAQAPPGAAAVRRSSPGASRSAGQIAGSFLRTGNPQPSLRLLLSPKRSTGRQNRPPPFLFPGRRLRNRRFPGRRLSCRAAKYAPARGKRKTRICHCVCSGATAGFGYICSLMSFPCEKGYSWNWQNCTNISFSSNNFGTPIRSLLQL